jgi:hypothetical protein
MPEINVNCLVTNLEPSELSASIAERGPNAGKETWNNAKAATRALRLDAGVIEELRDFFGEFGAWDDEERASWSHAEIKALTLQYCAGDLRELQSLCPGYGVGDIAWGEAERLAQEGTVSGNLFVHNGELWASLS